MPEPIVPAHSPESAELTSLKKTLESAFSKQNWDYVKRLATDILIKKSHHDADILEKFLTACLESSSWSDGLKGGVVSRVQWVLSWTFDFQKNIEWLPAHVRYADFMERFFAWTQANMELSPVYLSKVANWIYMHRTVYSSESLTKILVGYFSRQDASKEDLQKAESLYWPQTKEGRDISARISMKRDTGPDWGFAEKDAWDRIGQEHANRQWMTKEQQEKRRDDLAGQYEKDKNNQDVVWKLAVAYEQLEDWENAQKFYEWAFSLTKGSDKNWKNKANIMEEKLLFQKIKELKTAWNNNPDNATQITALEWELLQKQVEHAQFLVDQNPTDLKWHLTLGRALFKSAQQKEDSKEVLHNATIHTQKALKDPEKWNEARLLLAEIFSSQALYDMALHHLDTIIDKEDGMTELKKEVLYSKWTILEKSGKTTEAKKCFEDIYAYDAWFRDVATKVLKERK